MSTGLRAHGRDTTNKVERQSATYPVSVHEPTAKVLGTSELSGTDDSCPMFVTFDGDRQTKPYDAPPSTDELIDVVKPFVQP